MRKDRRQGQELTDMATENADLLKTLDDVKEERDDARRDAESYKKAWEAEKVLSKAFKAEAETFRKRNSFGRGFLVGGLTGAAVAMGVLICLTML